MDKWWIFILKPEVFNYLPENSDDIMWERAPLENLTKDKQLAAFRHHGFWKCMDTLRDNQDLNSMWDGNPKWKCW